MGRQEYDVHLLNSLNVAADDEQRDEKLAPPPLALSLTMYACDLSKLDALTVKGSLRPAAMERDSPDIDTLGGRGVRVAVGAAVGLGVGVRVAVEVGVGVGAGAASTLTFWLSVARFRVVPNRRNCAVMAAFPASQP